MFDGFNFVGGVGGGGFGVYFMGISFMVNNGMIV